MRTYLNHACLAGIAATFAANSALAQSPDILGPVSAGHVAAISDGDYLASTYADTILSPPEAGYRDMLTVLSIERGKVTQRALPVSNSVTAAPEIMELAPDGRTAFVTERLGERPAGGMKVADLPPGNRLFAIDLADDDDLRLADTAEVGSNPEALAVSPDGRRIAIVSNSPRASLLHIVAFADGVFGEVQHFDLAEIGVTGTADAPRGGVTATNVQWHPSGRYLAVNITTQNRVAFIELIHESGKLAAELWGNVVDVGKDPFVGRFTPDGRHYLTSNWGRDFNAKSLEGRVPEAPSTLSVIRLAQQGATTARHEVAMTHETGISAEGIAVSPSGMLVATINMQDTNFPPQSPRYKREASVSLLTFDPESSRLEKVGDYVFEGVLPEGGSFTPTGSHLLVTVFEGHKGATSRTGPGLEVFRVVEGQKPSLESLGRVPLPHGVHHVDVAPR